jgi:hypothetical protein
VHFDRFGGEGEKPGDLLGATMLGDEPQDLPLARGQPFKGEF